MVEHALARAVELCSRPGASPYGGVGALETRRHAVIEPEREKLGDSRRVWRAGEEECPSGMRTLELAACRKVG